MVCICIWVIDCHFTTTGDIDVGGMIDEMSERKATIFKAGENGKNSRIHWKPECPNLLGTWTILKGLLPGWTAHLTLSPPSPLRTRPHTPSKIHTPVVTTHACTHVHMPSYLLCDFPCIALCHRLLPYSAHPLSCPLRYIHASTNLLPQHTLLQPHPSQIPSQISWVRIILARLQCNN